MPRWLSTLASLSLISSPALAGTLQMLDARDSVFQLEVKQRASRALIVGDVFRSLNASDLGYGETYDSTGTVSLVDGKLLTNFHVVDNASELIFIDAAGDKYSARSIAVDPFSDLAHIEVEGWSPSSRGLQLTKRAVNVGDSVASIGYAGGLVKAYSEGVVTAVLGDSPDLGSAKQRIWTDSLITDGYSGGPLVNSRGECVGIIHAYGHPDAGVRDMGFVISTKTVRRFIEGSNGLVALGITSRSTPDHQGLIVSYIRSGSPAERAGIQLDDRITAMSGVPVGRVGELRQYLRGNTDVQLELSGFRGEELIRWNVARGGSETSPSQYESSLDLWRGLLLEWSDDEQGLYVVDVMPGSISERAGLSSDDRIVGINGVTQTIARDLLNTLQSDSQPFSLLLVSRGDQLLSLPTGPE